MHKLWNTQQWETANESEVIAALFNPPPFIDPADMGEINRHHPTAKSKYLNLYYHNGGIPKIVRKINQV